MTDEYTPISYPLITTRYNEFLKTLQSDRFIKLLLSGAFDTSSYENKNNSPDASKFNLMNGFTLKDNKLSWFTYPTSDEYIQLIYNIKQQMKNDNAVELDVNDMGTAFLLLVPGAHLQEHIDRGNFGGTTLVLPILGTGEFTYNNGKMRFAVDNPIFASNTVWHNFVNTTNKLVIIMTIAMTVSITTLKDNSLIPATPE